MTDHDIFVFASYGFGAVIIAGLIAWLWYDRNATIKELNRLEQMGVRRRSEVSDNE